MVINDIDLSVRGLDSIGIGNAVSFVKEQLSLPAFSVILRYKGGEKFPSGPLINGAMFHKQQVT